jgi:hypothetical protein
MELRQQWNLSRLPLAQDRLQIKFILLSDISLVPLRPPFILAAALTSNSGDYASGTIGDVL